MKPMKLLLFIGVIVFVLGIASFFVPFPQRERQTMSAGGMSVAMETTQTQTLPVTGSVVITFAGLAMALAGRLLRTPKA